MDWSTFTRKIYINEEIESLYRLWATPGGLISWFLRRADYANKDGVAIPSDQYVDAGDTYTWSWHNWDQYDAHGEVKEANGKDHIVFSFEKSMVSIELSKVDERVLVTLTQYDIPTDDESKMQLHVGCSNGWTFWLANLKSYCENGLLLNDKSGIVSEGMEWVNM